MLRKLGAYPRQNALATALRELGKLERTLFVLRYIRDVELRRRIHIGLNKGEARNALARAVFFNRLGKLRDRTLENQQHRASGLNLVVAAIVLWNTVYLERAVQALRTRGKMIPEAFLRTGHGPNCCFLYVAVGIGSVFAGPLAAWLREATGG